MRIHSIGIFANMNKNGASKAVQKILEVAQQASVTCVFNEALQSYPQNAGQSEPIPDLMIALGGDGTILRAANIAAKLDIPILGINLGRVGFMSEITVDEFPNALRSIEEGAYWEENGMMLQCQVDEKEPQHCVNEAILYKKNFSGIVDISVEIDGIDAGSVHCDGLIISTPIGSTGYSISAGGPIIAPKLDVAIITPICPHTLGFRPIIVSAESQMKFSMKSSGYLAVDGIFTQPIHLHTTVRIRRSDRTIRFIRLQERNLYELIKTKLS